MSLLQDLTPFQSLSLSLLAVLFVAETVGFWRDKAPRGVRFVRALVWLAAAVAIAWPSLVQDLANELHIGRGADLVFYLFVLLFLVVSFSFYSRLVRMQRQVTELVRHLAIQEARRGKDEEEVPE
jgi:hypothetical protein